MAKQLLIGTTRIFDENIPGVPGEALFGNITCDDINCNDISTADLIMSNDKPNREGNDVDGTKGSWVIQEGENDIFVINKKTGKQYKLTLTEV